MPRSCQCLPSARWAPSLTRRRFELRSYYDPQHDHFGCLRVINEDRVAPKTGFGTHAHREFEIFSYIVSGELEHKDSMGNREVMKRGDVQVCPSNMFALRTLIMLCPC